MTTDVLTAARERIAGIGLADDLLDLLRHGEQPSDPRLTDENAPDVWQAVARRLAADKSGAHRRQADRALSDLNWRLATLLDDVRHGVPAADLTHRYRRIREAQRELTMTAAGTTDVEFPDLNLMIPATRLLMFAGVVSNIDEVWPTWRDCMRKHGYDAPPWEHPDGDPFTVLPTPKNLLWLAQDPAKPWVPTLAQAARAVSKQTRAEEERRWVDSAGHKVLLHPSVHQEG